MNTTPELTSDVLNEQAARRLARRPWPAVPIRDGIDVSFEFFPPDTASGVHRLRHSVERLAPLSPSFMSVTYGAGGSSRERTFAALSELRSLTETPLAGHLTCVGASRAETHEVIERYEEIGVSHIVALRGDNPNADESGSRGTYEDAAALVGAIRRRVSDPDFEISVAAYPEVHPRASSSRADLEQLKRKIDAGATRAITQFFFDPDIFLDFLDRARSAGITVPIVPGIMPITNFGRIARFSQRCGTSIPPWMHELFSGLDDAPEVSSNIAATVAAEQCRTLAEHGVTEFHFYTMNQSALSAATCRILGVRSSAATVPSVGHAAS
jgi:methylenetetrahydrofolate reductase (NADPH)